MYVVKVIVINMVVLVSNIKSLFEKANLKSFLKINFSHTKSSSTASQMGVFYFSFLNDHSQTVDDLQKKKSFWSQKTFYQIRP